MHPSRHGFPTPYRHPSLPPSPSIQTKYKRAGVHTWSFPILSPQINSISSNQSFLFVLQVWVQTTFLTAGSVMNFSLVFLIVLLAVSVETIASPLDRWCRRPGQPCVKIKRGIQIWKSDFGTSEPRDRESLAFGLFNSRPPGFSSQSIHHISRDASSRVQYAFDLTIVQEDYQLTAGNRYSELGASQETGHDR